MLSLTEFMDGQNMGPLKLLLTSWSAVLVHQNQVQTWTSGPGPIPLAAANQKLLCLCSPFRGVDGQEEREVRWRWQRRQQQHPAQRGDGDGGGVSPRRLRDEPAGQQGVDRRQYEQLQLRGEVGPLHRD